MEFRSMFTFLSVAIMVYYVQKTVAFPRDSSVVTTEKIVEVVDRTEEKLQTEQILNYTEEPSIPVSLNNYREVICKFEEATEDLVCLNLCRPKGYSHGLCVGGKCTCV